MIGRPAACLLLALTATIAMGAQGDPRADALKMAKKVQAIANRGVAKPSPALPRLRTSFTDHEVNAYFKIIGPDFLPVGVLEPQVAMTPGGRIRTRATVDLDAALKPKERGWLDPLAYVGGKTEVTAEGVVQGANGMGTLQLERATLGGIPIPKTLLQELISYYTRTPEAPQGFDLDKPFPLPANIKSVETQQGAATIVQ